MFCDDIDNRPPSSVDENEQKSGCWDETSNDCLPPEEKEGIPSKLRYSKSELLESLPGSVPSYRDWKLLSVLGLPLLTNDMSLSRLDLSYDLAAPGLVKGDLSLGFHERCCGRTEHTMPLLKCQMKIRRGLVRELTWSLCRRAYLVLQMGLFRRLQWKDFRGNHLRRSNHFCFPKGILLHCWILNSPNFCSTK